MTNFPSFTFGSYFNTRVGFEPQLPESREGQGSAMAQFPNTTAPPTLAQPDLGGDPVSSPLALPWLLLLCRPLALSFIAQCT
jgi:hypothetical protein